MHHLHGVVVAFLTAVTTPASVLMLPRFDAALVTDALADASVFMAVPTMYQRLVDHVATLDDARRRAFGDAARALRLATSGSAALPVSLAERWRAITGSIPLERYGMTEIGMALSNPLDPAGRRAGTVGRVLPSVELRIVGDDDEDGDGPGELFVRGPSVMSGYLGRDESTRAAFREGWFMTGDIAVRDRDGYVKLLGRASSDILKSGGEKVSALEVEEVLREHDAIAEVAVVGVPDEVWGDRIVAAIVAREGRAAECSTDGLRAWAKTRLAPFKVPKLFVAVDALPRNAMGKVMKPDLVRRLRDKGE
jgi:malonyl-CoA/methylmalonyl-CoA synthetase